MTNEKQYGSLEVSLWHKWLLNLEEADAYFGIGSPKIREMIKEKKCSFVLYMGDKPYIIREKLEKYLDKKYLI